MPNKIQAEYYQNLPKKRMGAGILLFNEQGELLLVKPSYKTEWSIPGGVVEVNESPRAACRREIKEEIGLDIPDLQLLCIDYTFENNEKGESLQFIFGSKNITPEQIAHIHLQESELAEYQFLPPKDAMNLLSKKLQARLPHCLEALAKGSVAYLENGQK